MGDHDALNYPFIHIRDVEWLKRTLLIFPHVVRMVPYPGARDGPEFSEFKKERGSKKPLLREADINSPMVQTAQRDLLEKFKALKKTKHGVSFLNQFGKVRTSKTVRTRGDSYQIHSKKILGGLQEHLVKSGLAWTPEEGISDGHMYLQMHERVGTTVMTTLALACAQNEGLEVVTEFPKLHGSIVGQTLDSAFERLLLPKGSQSATRFTGGDVLNFIVYCRCDTSKLTVEGLAALNEERDAIRNLRAALEQAASSGIDLPVGSEKIRNEYLNSVVDKVLEKWKSDRNNLSNFVKALFGKDSISQPAKLLEKLAEKAFGPAVSGAGPAVLGSLTNDAVTGAAAGFAVGVLSYGANTWMSETSKRKNSPLRYLTMMEKNGVAFSLGPGAKRLAS